MIFTLFMCCFLGLGAMQPQVAAPRSYENNIAESKHKQNYAIGGQYSASRYFGMSDISTERFFRNVCAYLHNVEQYTTEYGSYWGLYTIAPENVTLESTINLGTSVSMKYLNNSTGWVDLGYLESIHVTHETDWDSSQYVRMSDTYYEFMVRRTNNTLVSGFTFRVIVYDIQYETSGWVPSFDFHSPIYDWNFSSLQFYEYYNSYSDPDALHFLSQMIIDEEQPEYLLRYNTAYSEGYYDGTKANNEQAYAQGFAEGQNRPNADTYNRIYASGRQSGYAEGLAEAQDQTTLASQIFTGFVEVGLLPVNVFLQMFEYEVFGINIAGFVSALITIAMVIIIIRVVTGKKDG